MHPPFPPLSRGRDGERANREWRVIEHLPEFNSRGGEPVATPVRGAGYREALLEIVVGEGLSHGDVLGR
jgi:hypothetical protein